MGGRSELAIWFSMIVLLYHAFEFLAGMESNQTACGNGDFFAGFGVTPGALRLVAQLEIAKTGQFYAFTQLQLDADFFEERFDHVFGLALVQTYFFKQQISQFSFSQCHYYLYTRNCAPCCCITATRRSMVSSISTSV